MYDSFPYFKISHISINLQLWISPFDKQKHSQFFPLNINGWFEVWISVGAVIITAFVVSKTFTLNVPIFAVDSLHHHPPSMNISYYSVNNYIFLLIVYNLKDLKLYLRAKFFQDLHWLIIWLVQLCYIIYIHYLLYFSWSFSSI